MRDEIGFGAVGLLVTVAILGMLAVVAVKAIPSATTAPPGASSLIAPGTGAPASPGAATVPRGLIPQAGDTVAQANLTSALSVVDQVALTGGGYGSVTASSLAAQAGAGPFTAGPSTGASQMSVASAGGAGGGVTLAVRAASGSCWFVWKSSAATWYGVETGRPSCAAPALGSTPTAGTAGPGMIGWQRGAFPAAH